MAIHDGHRMRMYQKMGTANFSEHEWLEVLLYPMLPRRDTNALAHRLLLRFGTADDMHAGGSFLHSAFYGGRIASALTFGAAFKLIKGGIGAGKGISNKIKESKNKKNGSEDESDKFNEESTSDSSGSTGEGGSE